jgi:hypothetical protein
MEKYGPRDFSRPRKEVPVKRRLFLAIIAVPVFSAFFCSCLFFLLFTSNVLRINWDQQSGSVSMDGNDLAQNVWMAYKSEYHGGTFTVEARPATAKGWYFVEWRVMINEIPDRILTSYPQNPLKVDSAIITEGWSTYIEAIFERFHVVVPLSDGSGGVSYLSNVAGGGYDGYVFAAGGAGGKVGGVAGGADWQATRSEEGHVLYSGFDSGTGILVLVDTRQGTQVSRTSMAQSSSALSPDASLAAVFDGNSIRIMHSIDWSAFAEFQAILEYGSRLFWTSDGKSLLFFSTDGPGGGNPVTLRGYDLASGSTTSILSSTEPIGAGTPSPGGDFVAYAAYVSGGTENRQRVLVLSRAGGAPILVDEGSEVWGILWIDGTTVLSALFDKGDIPSTRFVIFHTATGKSETLGSVQGRARLCDYDRSSNRLIYLRSNMAYENYVEVEDLFSWEPLSGEPVNFTPYASLASTGP